MAVSSSDVASDACSYTGEDFAFPFEPYDIQLDLMRAVYACLNDGAIGIMESPTGTGKSLSLLCAAAKWLDDGDMKRRAALQESITAYDCRLKALSESDDWIKAQSESLVLRDERDKIVNQLDALVQLDKDIEQARARLHSLASQSGVARKRKLQNGSAGASDMENNEDGGDAESKLDQMLAPPADYDPDPDITSPIKEAYAPTVNDDPSGSVVVRRPQVLYASRTHSQLAQFVGELRRCDRWAGAVPTAVVGSRQSLCANPSVRRLGSVGAMNDRCAELRQGASKSKSAKKSKAKAKDMTAPDIEEASSSCNCPYYNDARIEQLSDVIVCEKALTPDKLLRMGEETRACPYYASRKAVPRARLILMPYQILFNGASRDSWGVKLDGNAVVVDEAHNLLDAVAQAHGCELTLTQCKGALAQLHAYVARYSNRLNAVSMMYLKQSVAVVTALVSVLTDSKQDRIFRITDFLTECGLSELNLLKLAGYMDAAQLCRKLFMFSASRLPVVDGSERRSVDQKKAKRRGALAKLLTGKDNADAAQPFEPVKTARDTLPQGSPLYAVRAFLQPLSESDAAGRVLLTVDADAQGACVRYLLLDVTQQLSPLVSGAHSIVLAGGTMKPAAELEMVLRRCCGANEPVVRWFSCDHVVPKQSVCAVVLSRGPTDLPFKFTYDRRSDPNLLSQLGAAVVNVLRLVRGGTVIFFPSYDYMSVVLKAWTDGGVMAQIEKRVGVLSERRAQAGCDDLLLRYAKLIANKGAALLCAVVGGKLSEGINFADDLGRCVIMVGLPYPKRDSPQMAERMAYLRSVGGAGLAAQCYDSACVKAVNQCIGRVIRHKGDYAAVLLVDERYSEARIFDSLPKWLVGDKPLAPETFAKAVASLAQFYARLKKAECDG